jgi:hypothetical protein
MKVHPIIRQECHKYGLPKVLAIISEEFCNKIFKVLVKVTIDEL